MVANRPKKTRPSNNTASHANTSTPSVRIIAGTWRGRKLKFASQADLRPTPDRVRETLFNWLAPLIEGAQCLDLFAGSGALGFEAASRGAARVVMWEKNPQVSKVLAEQVHLFQASTIELHQGDALAALQQEAPQPFDIIFLDPPFKQDLLPAVCQSLAEGGWVRPGSRVYLESAQPLLQAHMPTGWKMTRAKQAGAVAYHLVEVTPPG